MGCEGGGGYLTVFYVQATAALLYFPFEGRRTWPGSKL